jgi:hypothetical protein
MSNTTRRPVSLSIENSAYPKVVLGWESPELCADNSIDWIKRSWLIDRVSIKDFPGLEAAAELIIERAGKIDGVPHLAKIEWKYKGEALKQIIAHLQVACDATDGDIPMALPLAFPGEFADGLAGSGSFMTLEEKDAVFGLAAIAFKLLDESLLRTTKVKQLSLLDSANEEPTPPDLPRESINSQSKRNQLEIASTDTEAA